MLPGCPAIHVASVLPWAWLWQTVLSCHPATWRVAGGGRVSAGLIFGCTRCGGYAASRAGDSISQPCPGKPPNPDRELQKARFARGLYPSRGASGGRALGPCRGLTSEDFSSLARRHGVSDTTERHGSGSEQPGDPKLNRSELLLRFGVLPDEEDALRERAKARGLSFFPDALAACWSAGAATEAFLMETMPTIRRRYHRGRFGPPSRRVKLKIGIPKIRYRFRVQGFARRTPSRFGGRGSARLGPVA